MRFAFPPYGLQADYDLDVASDRLADRIAREVKAFSPVPETQEISGS